ncbi:MAG: hypothetical protein AAB904_00805 [Patescibacteria group bacterium]
MGEKSDMRYAMERAKKITEALYRVTDLFPDKEPLKWNLRGEAVAILEIILSFENQPPKGAGEGLQSIEGRLKKLLALLDLAQAGSFISSLNFEVLKSEYRNLRDFLLSPLGVSSGGLLPVFYELQTKNALKGEPVPKDDENKKAVWTEEQPPEAALYEREADSIGQHNGQSYQHLPEKDRRSIIVSFLKGQQGRWVSIGELVALFKHNLSEKTLQRDLAGMIQEGVVDKQGDKRWRRYAAKDKSAGAGDNPQFP